MTDPLKEAKRIVRRSERSYRAENRPVWAVGATKALKVIAAAAVCWTALITVGVLIGRFLL